MTSVLPDTKQTPDAVKSPAVVAPLPPAWAVTDEILDTALCELVENMGSISSFAIPYARLPRRLSTYADRFPRWADVAGQTPRALLQLRKLGITAVEALIDAAAEAVRITHETVEAGPVGPDAAVARLVAQLNDYDQAILSGRVWALEPVPMWSVAANLGINPTSVKRNLPRAIARVQELLADPIHQEVLEHADALRRSIGPYAPLDVLNIELCRLGMDPAGRNAQALRFVAGPYTLHGRWVENRGQGVRGQQVVRAAVDEVLQQHAAPTTQQLLDALISQGMSAGVAITYLREHTPLRCFGDVWVSWPDAGVGDKAEAMLHVLGSPATIESVDRALHIAGASNVTSLARAMSGDDRFIRTSLHTWGLRSWGHTEYARLPAAIGQRIDAAGGKARTADIVSDILATYPDVAESSIRAYLATLAFIVEKGVARRRTDDDEWPPVAPMSSSRGGYLNGPNEVRVALPVNHDLLRGSGQPIAAAVAHAAGVGPGQRSTFTGPHGQLTLYWELTSTTGANIGSLRTQAIAVDAAHGDDLVLALRPGQASFHVTRLRRDEPEPSRLRKLLGHKASNPLTDLAASLQCPPERVRQVLQARGEHQLVAMFEDPALAHS